MEDIWDDVSPEVVEEQPTFPRPTAPGRPSELTAET